MNMNIDNFGQLFTDKKLQEILLLTGEKITNLPYTIAIFETLEQFNGKVSGFEELHLRQIKEGNVYANHIFSPHLEQKNPHRHIILLHEFNLKRFHNKEVMAVFCLYHELRHLYQYYYLSHLIGHELENLIADVEHPDYEEQRAEKDANLFAYNIMENNKEKMTQLLHLKGDWLEEISYRKPKNFNPLDINELGRKLCHIN